MSTWAELRAKVLSNISGLRNSTGDLRTAVDEALYDTYLDIVTDINPLLLLTETAAINLVNPATSLAIVADFSVSDLSEIKFISVNTNPSDSDSKYYAWAEMSYEEYLSRRDDLPEEHWSRDYSGNIHFTSYPDSGVTWAVKMAYYKEPAAFSDGGSPEIDSKFHHYIAYGAATMFPDKFAGERETVLVKLERRYANGIARMSRERPKARALKRLGARVKRSRYGMQKINWE